MQLAIRVSLVASQDHALVKSRAVSLVTMMEQLASSAMRAPALILVTTEPLMEDPLATSAMRAPALILVSTEPLMEDPLKALRTRALITFRVQISEKMQARSEM